MGFLGLFKGTKSSNGSPQSPKKKDRSVSENSSSSTDFFRASFSSTDLICRQGMRDTTASVSSASSLNEHPLEGKRKRKPRKEGKSANIKTVEALVDGFNNFTSEDALVDLFAFPDKSVFVFEDDFVITPRMWASSASSASASFPDMKFSYDSIQETSKDTVVIEGLRFSGTHTGSPYSCAPPYPAIPATGIHVVNDEERLILQIKEGKILRVGCIAMGASTGPQGVYEKIGGSLVLSSPPAEEGDCYLTGQSGVH